MDIINTSVRQRETYQVKLSASLLWECALGIAAITNTQLLDTLEKPLSQVNKSLPGTLLRELDYVQKNNTWKTLLQLLHEKECMTLDSFTTYIDELPEIELRTIAIPFTGFHHEETRKEAAKGNDHALHTLKLITASNPFFPSYIEFISKVEIKELKRHLVHVMSEWHHTYLSSQEERLDNILKRDVASKKQMHGKLKPEAFVEWATGGVTYLPEPSVQNVLLIPQYIYRPWTLEADIAGTKVFYYPVTNESINPDDKYAPNYFLVQKHKALGDEVRLRMVKLLSEKARSLQDITSILGLGKSTVHHHLKILRSARLVDVENATYFLKMHAVAALSQELDHYLWDN
ncbi:hypothetical protein JOD43_001323 [Pullulanibacillus pueri]|uniref:Transcriptional regulator n=1 Tax=Pullulanibacillus pueri TaxID=1437324 RepID=A0A8J3EKY2_9BACL|nr:metalloregulator ArsR/SmtB family transcription factor [Pullulanibacillus pueri]MBM7681156.1 hypothetical protein [Pullulanibacillus pueri]GGH77265.1 transcriptional regulator [Pullulanibacillus pueri]